MLEFSWIQGVLVVGAIAGTLVLSVPRPQTVPVLYVHQATRQQETVTMATTRTNHDDTASLDEPGDLFSVPEDPVLEPTLETTRLIDVSINTRIARDPQGAQCIHVYLPSGGVITAAEAAELIQNLTPAIEASAGIRNALGYDS